MSKYLISIIILLSVFCFFSVKQCSKIKAEADRLEDNQDVLLSDVRYYQIKDSINVASIGQLILTKNEYKAYKAESANLIKDLRIRLNRVESTSKTSTKTEYEVKTTVRDSIIYSDTLKCFHYRNNYLDLAGCLNSDSVDIDLISYDTIHQVVHRVPRKFLFIKYGTKGIRQEVLSSNPHTKITYTEYIKLK